jgi:hypothetical protein
MVILTTTTATQTAPANEMMKISRNIEGECESVVPGDDS